MKTCFLFVCCMLLCLFGCATAQEALIPAGTHTIGQEAFYGDTSLADVTLPEGVTTVGNRAFANSSVERIILPRSLEDIGEDVFAGCEKVYAFVHEGSRAHEYCVQKFVPHTFIAPEPTDFTWSSNGEYVTITKYTGSAAKVTVPSRIGILPVKVIGAHAFRSTRVVEVIIPEGVTTLEASVFYECNSLEKVSLPSTVTSIGKWCFYYCRGLYDVVLPEGLTVISDSLFFYCPVIGVIREVTIPSTVKVIENYAFTHCTAIQYITVPYGVTSIGSAAFRMCNNLLRIELPETLTTIGAQAFDTCSGLKNVLLPKSLISIHDSAFNNCRQISARVYKDSEGHKFCERKNIPYTIVEEAEEE